jgi:formate dehydrogenase (NADP+) beta subunit
LETVTLTIDGRDVDAAQGESVLEAALAAGIYIPHLCHHPNLPSIGACRLCIVEIEGVKQPAPACSARAANGMRVATKTDRLDRLRRLALELILSGHPADCGTCNKYLNCELQSLKQYLVVEELRVRKRTKPFPLIKDNPLFVHDFSRCVLCGRCVRACHELRGAGTIFYRKKGRESYIGTPSDLPLAESGCRFCGACAEVCPTGAIMDKEELVRGKSRKNALVPCRYSCPAEIDVPSYIRFIREKNYSAAAAVIREKVPFPGVLGYACNHPCETACRRSHVNQPISIRDLKRFAVEHDQLKLWEKGRSRRPPSGKKVAIIGAGPAGLTAAYYLANQGHAVTVFESLPEAGGMMRYGIPAYRLPREVLDREIASIANMGVEIIANAHVESVNDLMRNGYDAVLAAIGRQKSQRLSIPGVELKSVWSCVDFLRAVNLGQTIDIGKKVAVIGGGNAAFDCARVARRLGAHEVHLVCIESREEMPAAPDEIAQAEAEGVTIHPSKTAVRIFDNQGAVAGVETLDVASFYFDDDGGLQLEAVEGTEKRIDADSIFYAVGQAPDMPDGFGLDKDVRNFIEIDAYAFGASVEGVFAAGDAVSGAGSLIDAIASGRKGAMAIDRFLEGSGDIDEAFAPALECGEILGCKEGFAHLDRCNESQALPEQRIESFCKVVQDMDDETAANESMRCLQCDLRLKIAGVKSWSNY